MKPIRLLISDVDLARKVAIPRGYKRAYRIPWTNMNLFCLMPLNYIMVAMHRLWQAWWRVQMWIPRYVLYGGKYYDDLKES